MPAGKNWRQMLAGKHWRQKPALLELAQIQELVCHSQTTETNVGDLLWAGRHSQELLVALALL